MQHKFRLGLCHTYFHKYDDLKANQTYYPAIPVIIYTLGLSSQNLSQHQMQYSVSARPEADSEIVGEEDNGSLGLEPFISTAPFVR